MILIPLAPRTSGLVFFFQAEDGIRDKLVTGVQTCALPIYPAVAGDHLCDGPDRLSRQHQAAGAGARAPDRPAGSARSRAGVATAGAAESLAGGAPPPALPPEIGRASCRGRGENSGVGGSFKKKKERQKR